MARSTHILHVPIIGQRTNYECGNTALTSVLQYFGKHYSVDTLAKLANTRTVGTDHGDLIAAAVKTGATVYARSGSETALADVVELVSRGIPVIVGWWSMDNGPHFDERWTVEERAARDSGHYSVLRGYTPSALLLMDPNDGLREYADDEWMRVWYDTDTDAYELVKTWYMALNFAGLRFATEFGGGEDFAPATIAP